ncbi:hypothetical protein KHQ88_06295 [Mycoplasmatota bacterium]|nr:hypothetical protein KHQ88_06295 [Mycoplasmatota bacterium]
MKIKKIVLLTLFTLLLSGCSLFTYKTKGSINPDYYENYLEDLGYGNITFVEELVSQDMMDMTYDTFKIDTKTKSDFIYYYYCFDDSGQKFHAFMPEKVGEENVVFQVFLIDRTRLEDIVSIYIIQPRVLRFL